MRMVVGDHIGYRFEILSRLGKGSFGQVWLSVLPFYVLCTIQWSASLFRILTAFFSRIFLMVCLRVVSQSLEHLLPHVLY